MVSKFLDILKSILVDFWDVFCGFHTNEQLNVKELENVKKGELDVQVHSYSSDEPIHSVREDRFGRWPFASRIGSTIAQRTDPGSVVIGVYGPWGDGKSSVLKLLQIELENHHNIVTLSFNPWYFESQEQLLRSFFKSLADSIGEKLPTISEQIGIELKKYGNLLSLASIHFTNFDFGAGNVAQKLGETLSTTELSELRERIEKMLEKCNVRIVVLIDDIDRLDKEEIYSIFKLVKLSAGFKHISYILALDDEMVAGALRDRYGDGGINAGRNFLEKIVQVPLHLPAADDIELRKLAFEGVDAALQAAKIELSEKDSNEFVRYFVDGLEERLATPRQAKLYGNALTFALPLLKGEVNPVDHMLIEGIRIFYPKLYFLIRNNPKFFLGSYTERRHNDPEIIRVETQIESIIKEYGVVNEYGLKNHLIERLFPKVANVSYSNDFYSEWSREKRICADDYFGRYFRYSIPSNDVSDLVVDKFISEIPKLTDSEVDQKLNEISENNGMAKFIKKLRDIEDTIDPLVAETIALAIARNGDLLPREQQMFLSDWTIEQAAILVSQLLGRIKIPNKRKEKFQQVMEVVKPIYFGQRCLVWAKPGGDQREKRPGIIPEKSVPDMGKILADRIKDLLKTKIIYQVFGFDTPSMLWVWSHYGSRKAVESHLKAAFTKNGDGVLDYLDTFVGTSWGLENGLSHRSDFERSNYDVATSYVSVELIMQKLTELYGSKLDNPEYYQSNKVPFKERLAIQFAFIHQKVIKEQFSKLTDEEGNK